MRETFDSPGVHTRDEIYSEPRCWATCLDHLRSSGQAEQALQGLSLDKPWLFVGCGSSYYLAMAAAANWTAVTGMPARAVPASELLLFPSLAAPGGAEFQPVLISRSGHTSEILSVGERLKSRGIPIAAITCAPGQPLETLAAAALCLPDADEKSTVMTRSFSSMLVGVQFLAAKAANNHEFQKSLEKMPEQAQAALDSMISPVEALVESRVFADYVFLGQGPNYGLACEGALKVQEMSCSYSQAFHTMEFRHGPKSIVEPSTLITFLLSHEGYDAEIDVLEEVKSLGGSTLVVVDEADSRTRRAADLLIELQTGLDDYASLAARALPGQLLGLFTGLKKGLDPDHPRHLSRVVTLGTS